MSSSYNARRKQNGLLGCRLPRVASAAAAIARHWQELGGLGAVPFAIPAASSGARPWNGSVGPYGQPLGPAGMAHPGYLPPPPAAAASDTGLQPAMQQGLHQQAAQQLESRHSANPDGALPASDFADRSVFVSILAVRNFAVPPPAHSCQCICALSS